MKTLLNETKKLLYIGKTNLLQKISNIFSPDDYEVIEDIEQAQYVLIAPDSIRPDVRSHQESIIIGENEKVTDLLSTRGIANFSTELLDNETGSELLANFFRNSKTSLQTLRTNSIVKSYKLTSFKGIGYYSDIIALEISKEHPRVDSSNTRIISFNIFSTMINLYDLGVIQFPIDIDIICNTKLTELNLIIPVAKEHMSNIIGEILLSFEKSTSIKMIDLLQITGYELDYISLSFFWIKEFENSSTSYLIGKNFDICGERWTNDFNTPEVCALNEQTILESYCKSKNLNDAFYRLHTIKRTLAVEIPSRFIGMATYIKDEATKQTPPIITEIINDQELDFLLIGYHNQKIVERLTSNDKKLLLALLRDEKAFLSFVEQYNNELSTLNASDVIDHDEIVKVLGSVTNEDVNNWFRVHGKIPVANNDIWAVKRLGVLNDIKTHEGNFDRNTLSTILQNQLGESESNIVLGQKLIDESFNKVIGSKMEESINDIIKVQGRHIHTIDLYDKISKRDEMIKKMKSLIGNLTSKAVVADTILATNGDVKQMSDGLLKLSNDLQKNKNELINKSFELHKQSTNKELETANNAIRELQNRIRELRSAAENRDEITRVSGNDNNKSELAPNHNDAKYVQQLEARLENFKSELDLERSKTKNLESRFLNMSSNKGNELEKEIADAIKRTEMKYELKMKQINMISDKMANTGKKAQQDLISKKQEIVKLKADNTALKNQIDTLERKLRVKAA